MTQWDFWVDRGGTFTDIVAKHLDGHLITHKLLSEQPEKYTDAAVAGIRALLDVPAGAPFPAERVRTIKMGTTVATNALLERKGEPCVLAITAGLGDALRIGYQARPKLFALRIDLPEQLYREVVEIDERLSAEGEVLRALDPAAAERALRGPYERGIRAVAIVLAHGYRFPEHERRLKAIAQEIGYTQISISHEVSPLMKLVGRGDTTVVDAYLSPILGRYVDQVSREVGAGPRLLFMQSNGGLVDALRFRGKDAILSGPAGGIVGMARTSAAAGFDKVIGFDMGGTSTDVSHYAGTYERTYETTVAGVRLRAPMMHIHTVAAGGGSICRFDGARFRVGPESAGAVPGPACYRRGGPLTVTDCNVMLGKLQPAFFPRVFGPDGDQPLDHGVVVQKFAALALEIEQQTGTRMTAAEIAEGFVKIAVANIANAIKHISVARGYDVTGYTLACFGGAGGQHACLVADALRIERVMIYPFAGVLSAYGMGLADLRTVREAAINRRLTADTEMLEDTVAWLCDTAVDDLIAQGIAADRVQTVVSAFLKYDGTDTTLAVAYGAADEMTTRFQDLHQQRFGFAAPDKPLVIESLAVEAIGGTESELAAPTATTATEKPATRARIVTRMAGRAQTDTPLYARTDLAPGASVTGPAIITEATGTVVVEPEWRARVDAALNLILERAVPLPQTQAIGTKADPVMLEVFNNLFMAVAEQMGTVLQNTSYSVNIKERLDFSCAVFTADGALIANAPHIPVHLGSMGESVKEIIARHRDDMAPGSAYMLNDPYHGGTHLPDVTVIMPVYAETGGEQPLFFVAARGHHADIGGITPGSMPPHSHRLDEEGVLVTDFLLVNDSHFREGETRALLGSGAHPARTPDQNVADLKAQIAACNKGLQELHAMVRQFGRDVVIAYMRHVQDNAEEAVRRALANLQSGAFTYPMDDGTQISVAVTVDHAARSATVDFAGTSAQVAGNLNAPRAVSRAAILYVFRTLVNDDIPMNDGCLRPVTIRVPEGSLLNPRPPAAVVAGNVETSQAIVDALYGALGVMAASQSTMNNFTFGDETRQYYETICGGSGAGPEFDGTAAVQTHMTNSRLTDVEVLEWRFPVIVDRFAIRLGSGGRGRHRGGDGVIREIRFREPMSAAILSERRVVAPFGLAGGGPGALGHNSVRRADGTVETLSGTAVTAMGAGDTFVIETPGGGGYGAA